MGKVAKSVTKAFSSVGKEIIRPFESFGKELTRAGDDVLGVFTPEIPGMPEMPQTPDYGHAEAQTAEELRRRNAAKRGRASTMLSTPGGNLGTSNIGSKTLGGS